MLLQLPQCLLYLKPEVKKHFQMAQQTLLKETIQ